MSKRGAAKSLLWVAIFFVVIFMPKMLGGN